MTPEVSAFTLSIACENYRYKIIYIMFQFLLIMTVRKRRLLTPVEEKRISQFIRDRINIPELRELLLKYRPKLTNAINQQVSVKNKDGQHVKYANKTRKKMINGCCPIDKFLLTLKDLLDDEKIPTESLKHDLSFYEYKRPQFYSLKIMLKPFECGFECPSCPASILGKVSS